MRNQEFRGSSCRTISCKLKVASCKFRGLRRIINKVIEKRSLALLRKEEGGPSLAMVGGPIIPVRLGGQGGGSRSGGGQFSNCFSSVKATRSLITGEVFIANKSEVKFAPYITCEANFTALQLHNEVTSLAVRQTQLVAVVGSSLTAIFQ